MISIKCLYLIHFFYLHFAFNGFLLYKHAEIQQTKSEIYFKILKICCTAQYSLKNISIQNWRVFPWIPYKIWNKFDFTLIILATPSLVLWIFNLNDIGLQFLLVFRIARVFKFFRFIQFIPNVNKLIKGINQALKASVIVIIGFFIYNFVVSIVTCFLYQHIAPDYFGDPVQSFYTIFKIFTVEGWYEIPDLIADKTNTLIAFFSKVYFILILLTGGIFGLSLVNSIFVDAMVSDNNEDLEKKVDELSKEISRLRQNLE